MVRINLFHQLSRIPGWEIMPWLVHRWPKWRPAGTRHVSMKTFLLLQLNDVKQSQWQKVFQLKPFTRQANCFGRGAIGARIGSIGSSFETSQSPNQRFGTPQKVNDKNLEVGSPKVDASHPSPSQLLIGSKLPCWSSKLPPWRSSLKERAMTV